MQIYVVVIDLISLSESVKRDTLNVKENIQDAGVVVDGC